MFFNQNQQVQDTEESANENPAVHEAANEGPRKQEDLEGMYSQVIKNLRPKKETDQVRKNILTICLRFYLTTTCVFL